MGGLEALGLADIQETSTNKPVAQFTTVDAVMARPHAFFYCIDFEGSALARLHLIGGFVVLLPSFYCV